MIPTAAYVLISTIILGGYAHQVSQTTATFSDKPSCENAAQREDVALNSFQINAKWNLTCVPYNFNEGEGK